MSERFFVNEPIRGPQARLVEQEALHLARVLRAKVGDEVTLFDGGGAEFSARVDSIHRDRVELAVVARREIDRELSRKLTLAVALPKGDRQQWLVEKLTELGTTRLVPLVTRRGVAQPVDAAIARLRRCVVEASKQCGRNRLMEIAPASKWEEFVRESDARDRWIAHPDATGKSETFCQTMAAAEVIAAVGPEGGFTDDEISLARAAGWWTLSLGPRILRVETAAIAIAALASQR